MTEGRSRSRAGGDPDRAAPTTRSAGWPRRASRWRPRCRSAAVQRGQHDQVVAGRGDPRAARGRRAVGDVVRDRGASTASRSATAASAVRLRPGPPRAASPAWACADRDGFGELTARAVVLGCGGFEANPEWRARYLGRPWDHAKVRGTRYNTGDGLRMAIEIGALPHGQWTGCHSTPIDAEAPPHGDRKLTDKTNRLSYPYGVLVNTSAAGASSTRARTSSSTRTPSSAASSSTSRGGVAYQIFDAEGARTCSRGATRRASPSTADSLDGAGGRSCRWTASTLPARRSRTYNAAVGAGRFDPTVRDGLATKGLDAAEVELGAAPRHAAVRRVPGDRRHHVHLRRREGQRPGPGA